MKDSAELPARAQYTFDELDRVIGLSDELTCEQISDASTVRKTTRRTVVTLKYGTFEARHVLRQIRTEGHRSYSLPSAELAKLVAPGC